jgi:hypothetical protein
MARGGGYQTGFQCPDSGAPITASYAFGRLSVRAHVEETDLDWWLDARREPGQAQISDLRPEQVEDAEARKADFERRTLEWCRSVSGRYRSVEEANAALRRAGVDGMELLEPVNAW